MTCLVASNHTLSIFSSPLESNPSPRGPVWPAPAHLSVPPPTLPCSLALTMLQPYRPAFGCLHPPGLCSARLAPPLGMLPLWGFAWLPLAHHPSLNLNVPSLKSFTILPLLASGTSLVYFHPSFDGSCADINTACLFV